MGDENTQEQQATVPAAEPLYPHKQRCPKCNGTQFELLHVALGHIKAVCRCGWFADVVKADEDTLVGRATRRAQA